MIDIAPAQYPVLDPGPDGTSPTLALVALARGHVERSASLRQAPAGTPMTVSGWVRARGGPITVGIGDDESEATEVVEPGMNWRRCSLFLMCKGGVPKQFIRFGRHGETANTFDEALVWFPGWTPPSYITFDDFRMAVGLWERVDEVTGFPMMETGDSD